MTADTSAHPSPGSDFARLSRRVAEAGLMRRCHGYYVIRIAAVATLYAVGWVAFVLVGDSWWTLVIAVFMALLFGQVALVAHDVAHRQVFRRRRASEICGRIAGAAIGMSYGWWQDKHTRHHTHPNHEGLDPDIAPDLLVWTRDQARAATGLPRLIGRWQAFLFFPLLTLEAFNLHASGLRALTNRRLKHRTLDGVLLSTHVTAYLAALFLVLPPGMATAFLAVHQGLFGVYVGSVFAPNHKGMPIVTGKDPLDYLRRQVLTARNVRGGWLTDLVMGGLNRQIEHHLFPSMPSPHLRKAQPLVRDYCHEVGVDYAETSLTASWRQALTSLHRAGAPLRRGPSPDLKDSGQ
ncbi:acyl-CoA desaturase [Streptomyces sp. NPDC002055]|uniref:fatty acid desaturase family protein n=1 Tax=Streptomyces sp. NPDC002055 TaxID=3154534 RepID=UPI003333CE6B